MPYIRDALRKTIDPNLVVLLEQLSSMDDSDIEGALNYTITTLLESICGGDKWCYRYINRAVGTLDCVKMELYRRIAEPYEDEASYKNGDIPIYKRFDEQISESLK